VSEAEDLGGLHILVDGRTIATKLKELGWAFVDCIHLAGDKDMAMNFQGS
jgi:hypothetical protein